MSGDAEAPIAEGELPGPMTVANLDGVVAIRRPLGEIYSVFLRLRLAYYFGLLACLCLAVCVGIAMRAAFAMHYVSSELGQDDLATNRSVGELSSLVLGACAGLLFGTRLLEALVDHLLDAVREPALHELRATMVACGGTGLAGVVDGAVVGVIECVPLLFGLVEGFSDGAWDLRGFGRGYVCGALGACLALVAAHLPCRALCATSATFGAARRSLLRQNQHQQQLPGDNTFSPLATADLFAASTASGVKAGAPVAGEVPVGVLRFVGVLGATILVALYIAVELEVVTSCILFLGTLVAACVSLSLGLHGVAPSMFGGKYVCMVVLNSVLLAAQVCCLRDDLTESAHPIRLLPGDGPQVVAGGRRLSGSGEGDDEAGLPKTWRPQDRALGSGYPICNSRWGYAVDPLELQLSALDLATVSAAMYLPTIEAFKAGMAKAYNGTALEGIAAKTRIDRWPTPWLAIDVPNSMTTVIAVRTAGSRLGFDLYADIVALQFFGTFAPLFHVLPQRFVAGLLAAIAGPAPPAAAPPPPPRADGGGTQGHAVGGGTPDRAGPALSGPLAELGRFAWSAAAGRRLVFTGHSLGGAAAAAVAAQLGWAALAFSTPGQLLSERRLGVQLGKVLETVAEVAPDRDIMPGFDIHVAAVQHIKCGLSKLQCHDIVPTLCELWRSCGDERGRDFRAGCAKYVRAKDMPERDTSALAAAATKAAGRWYRAEAAEAHPDNASSAGDGFQSWHLHGVDINKVGRWAPPSTTTTPALDKTARLAECAALFRDAGHAGNLGQWLPVAPAGGSGQAADGAWQPVAPVAGGDSDDALGAWHTVGTSTSPQTSPRTPGTTSQVPAPSPSTTTQRSTTMSATAAPPSKEPPPSPPLPSPPPPSPPPPTRPPPTPSPPTPAPTTAAPTPAPTTAAPTPAAPTAAPRPVLPPPPAPTPDPAPERTTRAPATSEVASPLGAGVAPHTANPAPAPAAASDGALGVWHGVGQEAAGPYDSWQSGAAQPTQEHDANLWHSSAPQPEPQAAGFSGWAAPAPQPAADADKAVVWLPPVQTQ